MGALPKNLRLEEKALIGTTFVPGMQQSGWTPVYNSLRIAISQKCSPSAALLYIALCSHRNAKTNQTFVTINTLAVETGMSKKTVSTLLKKLYDEGYVIINSGKKHEANQYWFPYENSFDHEDEKMLNAFRREKAGS